MTRHTRRIALTFDALRYLIVSGALSPSLRRLIHYQADEEEAQVLLAACAGPHRAAELEDEVARRAELMRISWVEHPQAPPPMTPRCAALRSVVDDVMQGRL